MFKLNSIIAPAMSDFKIIPDYDYDEEDEDAESIGELEIDVEINGGNEHIFGMNKNPHKPKTAMEEWNAIFQEQENEEDMEEEEVSEEDEFALGGLKYSSTFSGPYQSSFCNPKTKVSVNASPRYELHYPQEAPEPRFLPHDHEQRLLEDIDRDVNVYADLLIDAQWSAVAAQNPNPPAIHPYDYFPQKSTDVKNKNLSSGTTSKSEKISHLQKLCNLGQKLSDICVEEGGINDMLAEEIKSMKQEVLDGGFIPSSSRPGTSSDLMENNRYSDSFNGSQNAGQELTEEKPDNISTEEELRKGHRLQHYKDILNAVIGPIEGSPETSELEPSKKYTFLNKYRNDLIAPQEQLGNDSIEQVIEELPPLTQFCSKTSNAEIIPAKVEDINNGNTNNSEFNISATSNNKAASENIEMTSETSQSNSIPTSINQIDNNVKFSTSESSCQTEAVSVSSSSIEKLKAKETNESGTLLSYEELKQKYESSLKKKSKASSCLKIFSPSRKSSKLTKKKGDSEDSPPSNP